MVTYSIYERTSGSIDYFDTAYSREEFINIILSNKEEYKYIIFDYYGNNKWCIYLMRDKISDDTELTYPYPKTKQRINEICRIVKNYYK